MLSHIIDVHIVVVLIQNVNFENVYLFKNNKLKVVQKYEKKNCYLIDSKKTSLTINFDNHKSTRKN